MPRKSAASLSVVPMGAGPRRPDPPTELTEAQATLWQTIVGEMPVDWLIAGAAPLLTAYVRHVSSADVLARVINGVDLTEDLDLYDQLTRMACRESAAICALSTKMRLAPSNRFDAKKRLPATKYGRRPWEPIV
jgi:hypothetical protein